MKPIEWVIILEWTIIVVLAAGIILLQIFLSRKENKWLGLILPLVALCAAIFLTFVTPFYVTSSEQTVIVGHTETGGEEVIENITTSVPDLPVPDIGSRVLTGIFLFLQYNIPTAILLLIYAACRAKGKRDAELAKMNVQDL